MRPGSAFWSTSMSWTVAIAVAGAVFACAFALSEWVVRRGDTGLPDADDAQDWVP